MLKQQIEITCPPCLPFFIILFIAAAVLSGCAVKRPQTDPQLDRKAAELAGRAQLFNQEIISSRGLGTLKIRTPEGQEQLRLAWAAQYPDKLRATLLMSANPVETIAADGEKVCFVSHIGRHSDHTVRSKDPDMKKYISLPVRLSEMILVLLGRLPVKNFDDVYFDPSDSGLSTIVLIDSRHKQSLKYDSRKNGFCRMALEKKHTGEMLYQIDIEKYKKIDSRNIPSALNFYDGTGRSVHLEIQQFIPNPVIKESVFKLTEHG